MRLKRRNKKVRKFSRFTTGSMNFAGLIFMFLLMALAYWVVQSGCTDTAQEIGRLEKQYRALEQECGREQTRWNALNTREHLDEKLLRFGIEMRPANVTQIIRMGADGLPLPGQLGVKIAKERNEGGGVVVKNVRTGKRR